MADKKYPDLIISPDQQVFIPIITNYTVDDIDKNPLQYLMIALDKNEKVDLFLDFQTALIISSSIHKNNVVIFAGTLDEWTPVWKTFPVNIVLRLTGNNEMYYTKSEYIEIFSLDQAFLVKTGEMFGFEVPQFFKDFFGL